jgi:hypothetical protein
MTQEASHEDDLKMFIRNTEERIADYKKQLEDLFKDKTIDKNDENFIWLKEFLREQKNFEERQLKQHRLEMSHLRIGMNPPSFYVLPKKDNPVHTSLEIGQHVRDVLWLEGKEFNEMTIRYENGYMEMTFPDNSTYVIKVEKVM